MRIENGDIKKRAKTGRRQGNLIVGGPVQPKYDLMSVAEAHEARLQYLSDRKKFHDDKQRERIRENMGSSFDEADYTGDLTATLRPMTQVNVSHLKLGQTFPERDLIILHIAEEANYRGIYCRPDKSNDMKLYCHGEDSFLLNATNSDRGWTITRCQVLEEERERRVLGSPTFPPVLSTKTPCSPYKASYIVPLIAKTIAETPMASNKVLRQILEPYGKPYCITKAILQVARSEARKLIFGNADDNVCYAEFVKEDLEKAGHRVSISFTTRIETMQNLDKIIIAEEAQRRKDKNIAGILPGQRKDFVLQWKTEHESQLFARLGTPADNLRLKFLNGILFAPSFVKTTVPHLQKVFMADACHLNFGKYTLFSCYGITANSNASPVAFATIFVNENTSTWRQFWKYALELHPYIDKGDITIITDQDPGQGTEKCHFLLPKVSWALSLFLPSATEYN